MLKVETRNDKKRHWNKGKSQSVPNKEINYIKFPNNTQNHQIILMFQWILVILNECVNSNSLIYQW